jgi:hypothetical protein
MISQSAFQLFSSYFHNNFIASGLKMSIRYKKQKFIPFTRFGFFVYNRNEGRISIWQSAK